MSFASIPEHGPADPEHVIIRQLTWDLVTAGGGSTGNHLTYIDPLALNSDAYSRELSVWVSSCHFERISVNASLCS